MTEFRIEKDTLGEMKVPAGAYYGPQAARAVENFPISGYRAHPEFIRAMVYIKKAAALVHQDLGLLPAETAGAIAKAADEILDGKLHEWFVVDVYQAGAGTSFNMNTNEVLANRAIELLGGKRGEYKKVHPNDHVNMAQSTNDSIPTAIRLSTIALGRKLARSLASLEAAFAGKANEFDDIVKSARTHLQDAVPIRLGQEFGGWAATLKTVRVRLEQALDGLHRLGLGATAAGTGLNAHPEYRARVAAKLSELTGFQLRTAEDYFEMTQSMADMLAVSAALRGAAVELARISHDLRLLATGPMTGFDEIRMPAVQPGSSIMPGKVNPVMAEMLSMVCFQVIGLDTAISYSTYAGNLDLNVMMPLIAYDLNHGCTILANAVDVFGEKCVKGITADRDRCRRFFETSVGLATVLNAFIGYEAAAEVAKECVRTGKSMPEIVLERKILSKEELDRVLEPRSVTEPGIPGGKILSAGG
jgi:aspartate ammonia-lyase